ncbi:MAG: methyltransferase domain-containing protein, partial [Clostridia bacterium]|nr:methyltransferase domain-containing protein [Clostridia bacterium]
MYQRFSSVYDLLMQDVDYTAWAEYLCSILKMEGIEEGATILECACGTGELTWRLYERGYSLIATDLSPDMLQIAQEKCRKKGFR